MATLRELAKRPERIVSGHRACAGCIPIVAFHHVMRAVKPEWDVVVANATGCMEVVTTIYPYTAWSVPWIHNAFENAAATISGVEAAYRSLKRTGKIHPDKEVKFIAFGGDGGTYDIGIQSLSGAMERGHDMLYVCYDNEAYMNTGIQRSGSTPFAADTKTAPVGKVRTGKTEYPKPLTEIMAAHNLPYVAQAVVSNWKDLNRKVEKALSIEGPAFINILAPCPPGWRFKEDMGVELSRLAVDTCFWPLYEVENGVYKLNYRPREKRPVADYMKLQGRFRHVFREENKHLLEASQKWVDDRWEHLQRLVEATKPKEQAA